MRASSRVFRMGIDTPTATTPTEMTSADHQASIVIASKHAITIAAAAPAMINLREALRRSGLKDHHRSRPAGHGFYFVRQALPMRRRSRRKAPPGARNASFRNHRGEDRTRGRTVRRSKLRGRSSASLPSALRRVARAPGRCTRRDAGDRPRLTGLFGIDACHCCSTPGERPTRTPPNRLTLREANQPAPDDLASGDESDASRKTNSNRHERDLAGWVHHVDRIAASL